MDLPPPVSQKSYERILRKINLASREVADDSMKNAAKEEVSLSGSNGICASGDGTWKTRGHTSRIGVCSVIGDVTGKVIDVAVLSSYCKGCEKWRGPKSGHSYEEWKLKHQPHCVKNRIGSSSKMEVDGMKEIFQRSVPQRNAKYIKYIGDGETKTFPELQRTAPYSIEKVECVGHKQKRMGVRLRKLKTMNCGKKLSDGKSISGKNRLTDKFIDTITTYYGNAIRIIAPLVICVRPYVQFIVIIGPLMRNLCITSVQLVEKGKEINVYRSSDCEVKVKAGVFEESVRTVAMCAQRVINPDDIGVGSLDLVEDKGVANPEGLIWESNCEEKDTIVTLTGGEKQLTVDRESFRNNTMAKIAGQLNGEKESMCKADVRRGLRDELAVRLTLSKPREIDKSSSETNRSSISSEFNFEIDLPGKRDRSTIYRLNLIKLYHR
ncbi:uncharacterized protein TNCV_1821481 [Trichonephila clavipes]|nr:uncharacterized protein TNCV_1821481 [Trichonephila clavipes]